MLCVTLSILKIIMMNKNKIETKKFSSVDGAKFDYIHQMQNYINSKIW